MRGKKEQREECVFRCPFSVLRPRLGKLLDLWFGRQTLCHGVPRALEQSTRTVVPVSETESRKRRAEIGERRTVDDFDIQAAGRWLLAVVRFSD